MKIAIGSDHLGFILKQNIKAFIEKQSNVEVNLLDFGVFDQQPVDYPLIAEKVALAIVAGEAERGILICGTGIGMAITANKIPGIRAAQAHDTYSVQRARMSNDAQIITLGAQVIGSELACEIIAAWLQAEFQGGRSAAKVNKINEIDQRYRHFISISH